MQVKVVAHIPVTMNRTGAEPGGRAGCCAPVVTP